MEIQHIEISPIAAAPPHPHLDYYNQMYKLYYNDVPNGAVPGQMISYIYPTAPAQVTTSRPSTDEAETDAAQSEASPDSGQILNLAQPKQHDGDSETIELVQEPNLGSAPNRKRCWTEAFKPQQDVADGASQDDQTQETMFEMVAKAIMASDDGEILLGDIYTYIVDNYSRFRETNKPNWRITVRHTLSVNSCFIKGKRAKNARGFHWKIHPSCLNDFQNNEFDKRKAARLVKEHDLKEYGRSEHLMDSKEGFEPVATPPMADCYSPHSLSPHDALGESMNAKSSRKGSSDKSPHIRNYVPMTTIPLTSYTYYELLVNLCELREHQ